MCGLQKSQIKNSKNDTATTAMWLQYVVFVYLIALAERWLRWDMSVQSHVTPIESSTLTIYVRYIFRTITAHSSRLNKIYKYGNMEIYGNANRQYRNIPQRHQNQLNNHQLSLRDSSQIIQF